LNNIFIYYLFRRWPLLRILVHHLIYELLQPRTITLRQSLGLPLQYELSDGLDDMLFAVESFLEGAGFVDSDTERPDVGLVGDGLAEDLFGAHVQQSSLVDDLSFLAGEDLGQTEVGDFKDAT